MTYQATGSFGAFSTEQQKEICLANEPSGAYWDNATGRCSGMNTEAQRMMCEVSGGRWVIGTGCTCPPSWAYAANANFAGCQAQPQAQKPRVRQTVVSVKAPKKAVSDPGSNVPRAQAPVVDRVAEPEPESGFPWAWVIGGVAVVSLVGVGLFVTRK
jgi:hypothetical protein